MKKKQKKIKTPKQLTKFWFVQGWGPLKVDTLVVIGYKHGEIIKICKEKVKADKFFVDFLEGLNDKKHEEERNQAESGSGYFLHHKETGASILWLPVWRGEWRDYETLIHELNHGVYFISRGRGMSEEFEFQAYQQEYLFREIRRKLDKELFPK